MKVYAFGYFDGLHSGHVQYLREAANHGRLVVGVGNDEALRKIKGVAPLFSEASRETAVGAIRVVDETFLIDGVDTAERFAWQDSLIDDGDGVSLFFNRDDLTEDQVRRLTQLSQERYFNLIFSERTGAHGESSSAARGRRLPYRVVLTSGADQLNLTKQGGGVCVGFPALFNRDFPPGSGMATSTRSAAKKIGRSEMNEEFAKLAFAVENPPAEVYIDADREVQVATPKHLSGAVDAILTFVRGVSSCDYRAGRIWPFVRSIGDASTIDWLHRVVRIVETPPRPMNFQMEVNGWDNAAVSNFMAATRGVEAAVAAKDTAKLIVAMNEASEAFAAVSPTHLFRVSGIVKKLRDRGFGVCVQGAGGGGCIAIVSEEHTSERNFGIL